MGSTTPVPAWSRNLDAQREARTIESAWRDGSDLERIATQPLLSRFVTKYPDDPRADGIRLRLAWIDIERQDLVIAEQRINDVLRRAAGVDADMAGVLKAAIQSERGQPTQALASLHAKGAQLVDADNRELWARVAIKVAFSAHAYDEAVSLMLSWRESVSEEHQSRAEREIVARLGRIDEAVLLRALDRLTEAAAQPSAEESRHRAKIWMLESVREILAGHVISRKNSRLARRLMAGAPTRFVRSEQGETLRRLAQTLDQPAEVMHAAIGLLLELDSDPASHASAELVTGAMRALAGVAASEPVRLVTRELQAFDAAETERALTSLVEDGVALLIAGLSSKTATIAVKVAESKHIAVMLLSEPAESLQRSHYATIMLSPAPAAERLFRATDTEVHRLTELTNDDNFCRADERLGWSPAFLTSRGTVFVTAHSTCALRLAAELRNRQERLTVWLGPSAAAAASAFDDVTVITSTQLLESSIASPVARWQERFQRLPSWDEALGYDVTCLGIQAIRKRGFDTLHGDTLVREAREKVRDALRQSECELMTTSARGFGGKATLEPTLGMRRLRGNGKTGRNN